MKTVVKLQGYISFDIVNDKRLQHSSIRVFFHLLHLYLKNGEDFIYNSLFSDMLEYLGIAPQTLSTALKQLKKYEYIVINENGIREVVINGSGSFWKEKRKGSPPRGLRASFEPQKADAATSRASKSKSRG